MIDQARADEILAATASPDGLVLLAPFALVIFLALRGFHILVTLTWGIIRGDSRLALALGLAEPDAILFFDDRAQDGRGRAGQRHHRLSRAVDSDPADRRRRPPDAARRRSGRARRAHQAHARTESVARAEVAIWSIVFSLNVFITINTAAEITAAPVVSKLGKRFKLHPYRRANMLDAVTSAVGYIFPWGGGVLIGYQTIRNLQSSYDFIEVVSPTEVWPFVLHGWFLAGIMLLAAITGFGRTYEGPHGEQLEGSHRIIKPNLKLR